MKVMVYDPQPPPVTIELEPHEAAVLIHICSNVGGPTDGPREVADDLIAALRSFGYGLLELDASTGVNFTQFYPEYGATKGSVYFDLAGDDE